MSNDALGYMLWYSSFCMLFALANILFVSYQGSPARTNRNKMIKKGNRIRKREYSILFPCVSDRINHGHKRTAMRCSFKNSPDSENGLELPFSLTSLT